MRLCFILVASLLLACQPPPELLVETDYCRALQRSEAEGRPVCLVFSAYGLGYDELYTDLLEYREIQQLLREEYVLTVLNIDDQSPAPERTREEVACVTRDTSVQNRLLAATKVGEYHAEIQRSLYDTRYQPQYLLLDQNGTEIVPSIGYTGRNFHKFMRWLRSGLE